MGVLGPTPTVRLAIFTLATTASVMFLLMFCLVFAQNWGEVKRTFASLRNESCKKWRLAACYCVLAGVVVYSSVFVIVAKSL